MVWILLVLIYGISKGLREVFKKKALETSTTIEVLFLYTFISFLLVSPEIRGAGGVPARTLALIAVKSLIIFIAWIAGFTAVKNLPVGVYGLLDQMRLIFAMLLGVLVLHERMGAGQVIGLVLVIAGLL
ncbi:MAG: EamA family transporter, partial [Lachnospiraceae bacterium]|nr:EamA family transporter [Lachnospiraceae bacterium]